MYQPLVSIVILNFNSEIKTKLCIESIKKLKYKNVIVILVDNSTIKKSTESIKKIATENGYMFIRSEENMGYAAGNKLGVEYALQVKSDYVFILNNDTYLEPSSINKLVEVMESDKSIWICGPVLKDLDHVGVLSNNVQSAGFSMNKITGKSNANTDIFEQKFTEYDFVSGAALMIRRDCLIEEGFMKEDFFLYYEETDYCYNIKWNHSEKKIGIANEAVIWHEPSSDIEQKEYSLYYSNRNKIIFMNRHFKQTFWLFVVYYFFVSLPKKILKYLISSKLNMLRVLFKSICHGFQGKMGIHN